MKNDNLTNSEEQNLSGYLLGNTEHVEKFLDKQDGKKMELPSVWDFVEKYYPNYSSSDEIAYADDLSKVIHGELNGYAEELWKEMLENAEGNEELAKINAHFEYNTHHISIYNEAIEGLGVKGHDIYAWVTGLIGSKNEKVVRYTELVCKDIAGNNLTHDEEDEKAKLGVEVREEAITNYIAQKGGL